MLERYKHFTWAQLKELPDSIAFQIISELSPKIEFKDGLVKVYLTKSLLVELQSNTIRQLVTHLCDYCSYYFPDETIIECDFNRLRQ